MPELAARVRAKLAADALPLDISERVVMGYGDDDPCSVCDEPITGPDVEHEITTVLHGTLKFHHDCLSAWRSIVRARR